MKQSRTKVAHTIADRTLHKGASKQLSQQIAAYLLSERRVQDLGSLMRDVQADWAESGYVEVIVTSAHPLTTAIEADITRQVKTIYPHAKTVVVTSQIDTSILGGVEVRLAHQQFDASVVSKLDKFKQLTAA